VSASPPGVGILQITTHRTRQRRLFARIAANHYALGTQVKRGVRRISND
jgi:hypothetical protein